LPAFNIPPHRVCYLPQLAIPQIPWNLGPCRLSRMVDIDLIVETLRKRGHAVERVISVPENAGEFEFIVDGNTLNLAETRSLLEQDETK